MSVLTAPAHWVLRARSQLWPNLHVLLAASLPVGIAAWAVLNLSASSLAAGVVAIAALPLPVALAVVSTGAVLLEGGLSREYWRSHARPALPRITAVSAALCTVLTLTLVALEVHLAHPVVWTLLCLVVASGVTATAGLLTVLIVPLIAEEPSTRWSSLFVLAVAGLRRRPLPALATVLTIVAGVRLALWLPITWALVPGALALLVHVAGWTTAEVLDVSPQEGSRR